MKHRFFFYFSIIFINLLTSQGNASNFNIDLNFVKVNSIHICNVLIGKNELNGQWFKKDNNLKKLYYKNKNYHVTSRIFKRGTKINLITLTFNYNLPIIQLRLDKNCSFKNIRLIKYKDANPNKILSLDKDLKKVLAIEDLNPIITNKLNPTKNNLIALVDTGVNYNLKTLSNHIAVKEKGKLFGYDFWDNDQYPFDNDPRRNPFYPRHHGTTVFSVIKNEAPNIRTAIYRFPALKMCKFKKLIKEISDNNLRIVNLSMGSRNKKDWECFLSAAKKYNHLIFVVSAGNAKQDIDIKPIYPASFDLENIITVSSSTKNGLLGRDSNYGSKSVDFLLPAERILVTDHRGVNSYTGGTSYAVPRMSALIARFLNKNINSSVKDILLFLKQRAIPSDSNFSKYGWIPDPSDDYLIN